MVALEGESPLDETSGPLKGTARNHRQEPLGEVRDLSGLDPEPEPE